MRLPLKQNLVYILGLFVLGLYSFSVHKIQISTDSSENTRYFYLEKNCSGNLNLCSHEILKLKGYDTLIYVRSGGRNGDYFEVWGKLTRINDSIFYAATFRCITKDEQMPVNGISEEWLYFYCDSSLIGTKFSLQYEDKSKTTFTVSSVVNKFPIDKSKFNFKSQTAIVTLERNHPIFDEKIRFRVSIRSDIRFLNDAGHKDFYIVLNENCIKSLNSTTGFNCWNDLQFKLLPLRDDVKFSGGKNIK